MPQLSLFTEILESIEFTQNLLATEESLTEEQALTTSQKEEILEALQSLSMSIEEQV